MWTRGDVELQEHYPGEVTMFSRRKGNEGSIKYQHITTGALFESEKFLQVCVCNSYSVYIKINT